MKYLNLAWHMNARFTAHPVGHGLFYTGIFTDPNSPRKMSFVYDCGSRNQRALKSEIHNFRNWTDRDLDMLVLSHLHEDHCNGLNELIGNDMQVDYVFMPYLDIPARILLLALCTFQEEWFINFLIDPVGYFLGGEHRRARKVVLMTQDPNQGIEPVGGPSEEPPGDEFPFPTLEGNPLHLIGDAEAEREAIAEMPEWREHAANKDLLFATTKSFIDARSWLFKFFYVPPDKQDLIRFYDEVKRQFPNLDIRRFRDGNERRKLRELYDNISKSAPLHRNINNTSLVMLERKVARLNRRHEYLVHGGYWFGPWLQDSTVVGCLLLGDIDLNVDDIASRMVTHFRNDLTEISSVVVPHHGRSKNWNSRIATSVSAKLFIISAARGDLDRVLYVILDLIIPYRKSASISAGRHGVCERVYY